MRLDYSKATTVRHSDVCSGCEAFEWCASIERFPAGTSGYSWYAFLTMTLQRSFRPHRQTLDPFHSDVSKPFFPFLVCTLFLHVRYILVYLNFLYFGVPLFFIFWCTFI
jgi:hypothetical protein